MTSFRSGRSISVQSFGIQPQMFIRQSGKTRIVGTDSLLWMDTQIILTAAKSPAKLTVVKVKP